MAHWRRILLALAVAAAGAVALVANVALLGLANETDDPVGRLRPVQAGLTTSVPQPTVPTVTEPQDDDTETDRGDHDADDD